MPVLSWCTLLMTFIVTQHRTGCLLSIHFFSTWLSSRHLLWAIKYLLNKWLLVSTSYPHAGCPEQAHWIWLTPSIPAQLHVSVLSWPCCSCGLFLFFYLTLLSSVRSYCSKYWPTLISLIPKLKLFLIWVRSYPSVTEELEHVVVTFRKPRAQ